MPKQDLDIMVLDQFLDCDAGRKIEIFELCGDYGDAIYYPKLFDFIRHFRDTKTFRIHTNGSYQTKNFWTTLSQLLGPDDTIIFGIDGLEDTHHLYRKNADWQSIMLGIDIMGKSCVKIIWKTIIFKFNYESLDKIQTFAESKGAHFITTMTMTHRFGDNSLMPPDEFILTYYLYKKEYSDNMIFKIVPQCESECVVTANGYFLPCDWIRYPKTFYKSQLWQQPTRWMDKLKMSDTTLEQAMLVVKDWSQYVRESSIHHPNEVSDICKMKCREGC